MLTMPLRHNCRWEKRVGLKVHEITELYLGTKNTRLTNTCVITNDSHFIVSDSERTYTFRVLSAALPTTVEIQYCHSTSSPTL